MRRSLATWIGAAVLVSTGCVGGVNMDGGDIESEAGPQDSPRSDGATLVYSAFAADTPDKSAQNAAFSPDGRRIVFTVFVNGYNAGPAELWIVDLDGSNPHRVTSVEDQDNVNVPGAAWNAARGEIVFASDREEADDLWAIRPDGTGVRRITRHTAPPFWIEPVWSPDGVWIVFESDTVAQTELQQRGTVFKVRFDGTELTQLTKRDGEDFDDRLPNWSPAGNRILFQRRDPSLGDGDNWDVYVVDTDGDDPVNVSRAPGSFNTDNSWSPDGRWIASSSQFPADGATLPHPNIIAFFVPDDDGAAAPPVRITFSDEHEDGAPSVSPDGRAVAFESHQTADENSPSDIWIITVPDSILAKHESNARRPDSSLRG